MLFLLKLVRLDLFLLLASVWLLYGWLLFEKLAYPDQRNLDGTGYFLSGLLLTVFSAAIVSNFRKGRR